MEKKNRLMRVGGELALPNIRVDSAVEQDDRGGISDKVDYSVNGVGSIWCDIWDLVPLLISKLINLEAINFKINTFWYKITICMATKCEHSKLKPGENTFHTYTWPIF